MRRGGFTLLEMAVVIAIVAMITSILTPAAIGWLNHARRAQTLQRVRALANGTYGVPGTSDHGFLGDIGRLPNGANFAKELSSSIGVPAGDIEGVRYGWHGSYAPSEMISTDAWGHSIVLDSAGRFVSGGPDATTGTPDDIVWPDRSAAAPLINPGPLDVIVFGPASEEMPESFVPLSAADVTVQAENMASGTLSWLSGSMVSGTTYFSFPSLQPGYHVVVVAGRAGSAYQNMLATARVHVEGTNGSTSSSKSWASIYLTGSQADAL